MGAFDTLGGASSLHVHIYKAKLFPKLIFENCKSCPKILIKYVDCTLHMKKPKKKKNLIILAL